MDKSTDSEVLSADSEVLSTDSKVSFHGNGRHSLSALYCNSAVSCTEALRNPHSISVEFVGFRKVSCDMYHTCVGLGRTM